MQLSSTMTRRPTRPIGARLAARLRHLIHTRLWGMDIDATCDIEKTAWIDRTWPKGVHIGAGTYIGEEAVVLTHDLTRGLYLDTRIGHRCIIGPRAIVMPGCTIGDDCIVLPGSVVTRDIAAHSTVIGNPARSATAEDIDLTSNAG